jgi:Domain of unknown function (DUF1841).
MTKPTSPRQRSRRKQVLQSPTEILDEHILNLHPGLDERGLKIHVLLHVLIERQLDKKEPPEIVRALMRLQGRGESRHEAIHAIAAVMAHEAFQMLRDKRPLDHTRYIEELRRLGGRQPNHAKTGVKSGRPSRRD